MESGRRYRVTAGGTWLGPGRQFFDNITTQEAIDPVWEVEPDPQPPPPKKAREWEVRVTAYDQLVTPGANPMTFPIRVREILPDEGKVRCTDCQKLGPVEDWWVGDGSPEFAHRLSSCQHESHNHYGGRTVRYREVLP